MRVQLPGQPDCLGAELDPVQGRPGAGGVALVEDEVQDMPDGDHPVGQLRRWRQDELCCLETLLRAADPLAHGRVRDQQRAGDLRRGEAAHGSQRQRDLRYRGESRMAAQHQQGERIVLRRGGRGGRWLQQGGVRGAGRSRCATPRSTAGTRP